MPEERKTYQQRKESLFNNVDSDGSGQIDQTEFSKLYDLIRLEAQQELAKEAELERQAAKAQRKVKVISGIALAMFVFLALSVAANASLTFAVVDTLKDTSTSTDGALKIKGTEQNVKIDAAIHSDSQVGSPRKMVNGMLDSSDEMGRTKTLTMNVGYDGHVVEAGVTYLESRKGASAIPLQITPGNSVQVQPAGQSAQHNMILELGLVGLNHPIFPAAILSRVLTANHTTGSLPVLGLEHESFGAILLNSTDLPDYQDLMWADDDELSGFLFEESIYFSEAHLNRGRMLKMSFIDKYVEMIRKYW